MIKLALSTVTFIFLSSGFAFAEDLVDPLAGINVSSDEIMKSLESMKASGQINKEDYEKAKLQLATMSSAEIKALNDTAIGMVRNDPDKAVELTKKPFNEAAVKDQLQNLSRPQE